MDMYPYYFVKVYLTFTLTLLLTIRIIQKALFNKIVRAVRSKKYVYCTNWNKRVKLGTETHDRLYVKNFKGDTSRKSREC